MRSIQVIARRAGKLIQVDTKKLKTVGLGNENFYSAKSFLNIVVLQKNLRSKSHSKLNEQYEDIFCFEIKEKSFITYHILRLSVIFALYSAITQKLLVRIKTSEFFYGYDTVL